MATSQFKIGDTVVTTFSDPGLPEGSVGTVKAVYDDLGDGIDVQFDGTRELSNVMSDGLELVVPAHVRG
ncbi:hypothetical protein [Streptomyces chrestomyceticus]|uniref:hypothetical protein n=1 Tax=Streptomyces chrestomyceticus TaxID=68185 RepID=UPI003795AEE8